MRFPGFEGEWENEKSGILCESIVPGRNKPKNFEGDIPWITTPDIEQNGEILFSKKGLNISKEEAKKIGSKIVPSNSIIISCVGELGLVAFTGKEIIINQQLHAFIPKERIDYKFLLYQLSRQKKYMDSVATKTAVPYMNKDNCNSIPIFFPNLIEQHKIASFLSLLDERISTQNKIIEELKLLKNTLSKKIFSGKLMFKNDYGSEFSEWKIEKLGNISTITTGTSNREDSILNGKYTFFDRSQDIRTSNKYLFDKEAIIVPGEGQEFIPKFYEGKFDLHQRTYAIFDFVNAIGKYLFFYILSDDRHLQSQAVGSTVKSLRLPMFQSMPIKLPCIEEQTKIANFLSSIDVKIDIENNLLKKLEKQKKYLLVNLFI